jgi:hypothetical protein
LPGAGAAAARDGRFGSRSRSHLIRLPTEQHKFLLLDVLTPLRPQTPAPTTHSPSRLCCTSFHPQSCLSSVRPRRALANSCRHSVLGHT